MDMTSDHGSSQGTTVFVLGDCLSVETIKTSGDGHFGHRLWSPQLKQHAGRNGSSIRI